MEKTSTQAKWADRVEGWRRSGLTAPAFAAGKEFTASGLRYWASRLQRAEMASQTTAPRPAVRLARIVTGLGEREIDTPIVVETGGARVVLRRGFDREALGALLEILSGRGGER